jgi:4-amino-4-deoxy-L-arabinose transferase-like glycosyltransferase
MIFGVIFLFAVVIRLVQFGLVPTGINQDEAMGALDAKALAQYGTDRFGMRLPVHFTAWGSSQMSVLLSYCMVPFIRLFGFNIYTIRLPILLFSLLGCVFLYLIAKKIWGQTIAYFALGLVAVCPWHFMQSRWALDCNLFPHMFLIGFYLLLCGLEKRRYLYLSMVFFALCFYCYGIAVYTVPVFLVVYSLYLIGSKAIKWKELLICALIFGIIALPEMIVMAINMLHLPTISTPLFTMPNFPNSNRSNDILFFNFSWMQLGKNVISLLTKVFLQLPDIFFNTIPQFGVTYHLSIPFLFLGLYGIKKELPGVKKLLHSESNQLTQMKVGVLLFFLMGIWLGVVTFEVNINRIAIIFYPMLLITAVGIGKCILLRPKLKGLIFSLYGVCSILFLGTYFTAYAAESRNYYNQDFLDAVSFADTLPEEELYITCNMSWQINPQMSEILTQYALSLDAHYVQGLTNENNGLERLPYKERYHYAYPEYMDYTQPSIVYVLQESELSYVESNIETEQLAQFGAYYVLIPSEVQSQGTQDSIEREDKHTENY